MMSETLRKKFRLFIEFRGDVELGRMEEGSDGRECDHCIANLFICT